MFGKPTWREPTIELDMTRAQVNWCMSLITAYIDSIHRLSLIFSNLQDYPPLDVPMLSLLMPPAMAIPPPWGTRVLCKLYISEVPRGNPESD